MKCNMCVTGEMVYSNMKGTHIYSCEDCPNVQFEYCLPEDLENLKEYLNCFTIEGLRVLPIEKAYFKNDVAYKFQLINPYGDTIVLHDTENDDYYEYFQMDSKLKVYGSDSLEFMDFHSFDLEKELQTPKPIDYKKLHDFCKAHSNNFEDINLKEINPL